MNLYFDTWMRLITQLIAERASCLLKQILLESLQSKSRPEEVEYALEQRRTEWSIGNSAKLI